MGHFDPSIRTGLSTGVRHEQHQRRRQHLCARPTVASTQAIFSQLDRDSDGRGTESEFNLTVTTLVNQLADAGHRLAVQGGANTTAVALTA